MLDYNRLLYLDGVLLDGILGPHTGIGTDNALVRWDGTGFDHIQECPNVICDDNGNIGIGSGASSPCSLLEVWDDDAHPILSITAAHATDYDPQIQFRTDATDTVKFSMGVDGADDKFKIFSGNGIGGSTEIVIDSDGNLGVGTDAPGGNVHIVGSGYTGKIVVGSPTVVAAQGGLWMDQYRIFSLGANRPTNVSNYISNFNSNVALMIQKDGTGAGEYLDIRKQDNTVLLKFDSNGNLGIGEALPETLVELTHASPYFTFHNSTEEDSDGGRESRLLFKGEQSGGEESTLASIVVAHDGSGDDQKAYMAFAANDGADDDTPTEIMRIDSQGYIGIGVAPTTWAFEIQTETQNALRFKRNQTGDVALRLEPQDGYSAILQLGDQTDGDIQRIESDNADNSLTFWTNNTRKIRITALGNIGIGTTAPDKVLEINKTTGGEIRLTYNDSDGSATDYCDMVTDSNGGFTLTTVDSDGAAGHVNFNPDGYVGIKDAAPGASLQITNAAAGDIGQIIELATSPTGNAFEINTNGASGGDLVKITSGGKIQTTAGVRSVANEFGDAFISWGYGGDTAEHSGQTGSYDHTGGTYDRLFTATAAVFDSNDEVNHTWIVIKSGAYKGAKAEIETYIDTTNVIVRGMGWDGDISSATFDIVPHPSLVVGDGFNLASCVGNQGNFHVRSKGFIGLDEESCIVEFIGDFGADDKECFCMHVEANGYNHIDGMHMDYSTGDLQPGDYVHGIHISVDDTEATSADSTTEIDCLSFETTDASSMHHHAVHVGVGFDSALVVSGASAEDPDYGYEVTSGSVVDRVNSGGAGDDAFVNAAVDQQIFDNDNDYILIGNDATFEVIQCILTTPSNQDTELEFYYSKAGGGWTQFYPSDDTSGFTKSGNISFTAPGDWTKDDEAEANGDITDAYYVKIVRTRNNLVTPPTEDYFKIYTSLEAGMEIRGDGAIRLPYLSAAPANLENGLIWMESDGLHIYYGGAEKVVAGA